MDDLDELLSRIDEDEDKEYTNFEDELVDVGDVDSEEFNESTELADNASDSFSDELGEKNSTKLRPTALKDFEEKPQPEIKKKHNDSTASIFTLQGTKSWNTKEPYIIHINQDTLEKEKKYLKSSFYFIKERETDRELKEHIREHLFLFLRRPAQNIIQEYDNFIYTTLINENEKLIDLFQFSGEMKNLFIYNAGPFTYYKIINTIFQSKKAGFCYRLEATNKSIRFYPGEYFKEKILIWFEENINSLNIPFDSIQSLNDIKNEVAKKYSIEVKKFTNKLDDINTKIAPRRSVSREQLISLKGDELFGLSAIEVYMRFIERTIFHKNV